MNMLLVLNLEIVFLKEGAQLVKITGFNFSNREKKLKQKFVF